MSMRREGRLLATVPDLLTRKEPMSEEPVVRLI